MKFYYTLENGSGYYEIEAENQDQAIKCLKEKLAVTETEERNFLDKINLFLYDEREWEKCVKKYYVDSPFERISYLCKPRLFVDMDGTLAEWRNIQIDIEEYEDVSELPKKIDEILRLPGYFKTLKPNINVVNCMKQLLKEDNFEIYILSCVLSDTNKSHPEADKNAWLDKYLPEIDKKHRIFVPDGKDKKQYVPLGVGKNDYLLDDYTKNLKQWEQNGTAIKLLNGVNANKGTWNGSRVSAMQSATSLASLISQIISKQMPVKDKVPQSDTKPFNYKEFRDKQLKQELKQEGYAME